jgi:hypothetical protein
MPPQQGDGLLDLGDVALGFRAHQRDIGISEEEVKYGAVAMTLSLGNRA